MITGLNHITLAVRDAEESFHFYTQVLGLRPVARWPKGAYLLAGDVWIALVVDSAAREHVLPEYTHIAFTVSPTDFPSLRRQLQQADVPTWQENRTEGESLYFADPNGHKLEIHASDLATRLKTAHELPWEGLEFF
jgi:catechol 2,3-dioxygenase-like lactoylglutathione lyase family enzyme